MIKYKNKICKYCKKPFVPYYPRQDTCNIYCRILSNCEYINGCLVWNGHKCKDDYGKITYNFKSYKVHRLYYELYYDVKLSPHEYIIHKCDNPSCCNIDHLSIGTCQDNIRDKMSKNRQAKGSSVGTSNKNMNDIIAQNIINDLKYSNKTLKEISSDYNVSKDIVYSIYKGYTWKHVSNGKITRLKIK